MLLDTNEWKIISYPGYSGKAKGSQDKNRDKLYGSGNWKSAFAWGNSIIDRKFALQLYEDAYYNFFRNNLEQLDWLCENACDVYDNALSNVDSGFDYSIQETNSTHLQDIAVRNVLLRLGRTFNGNRLIEIRGKDSEGYRFNPGRVPFHMPDMIKHRENNPEWIDPGSIEDFWQSNKVLVVQKSALHSILAVDAIVLNKDGKILLIERNTEPAGWALPGGKLDYGESLAAAALREVEEETGLKIDIKEQFRIYDNPDRDPRHHFVSVVFIGITKDTGNIIAGAGVKKARFFSPKGIPEKLVFDHQIILNDYFASRE